jgi:hypothetical protein
MRAGAARVSWTSVTLSSARVTSGLVALSVTGSALGVTGLTGRLSAASLARVARSLAGRLSTARLARVAGILTLRRAGIASFTCIARTGIALCAARIATRTEAGISAARTGETGLRVTGTSAGTFGVTCASQCPRLLR